MTAKSTRHRTQGPVADLSRACIRARWLVILTWGSITFMALLFSFETDPVASYAGPETVGDFALSAWAILPISLLALLLIGALSTTAATLLTAAASGTLAFGLTSILASFIEVPDLGRMLALLVSAVMVAAWGTSLSLRYLGSHAAGRQAERAARETMSAGGQAIVVGLLAVAVGSAVPAAFLSDPARGILLATSVAAIVGAVALATLLPALWGLAGGRIEQFAARRAASTTGGLHTWAAKVAQARQVVLFLSLLAALALATPIFGARLTGAESVSDDLGSVVTVAVLCIVAIAAIGIAIFVGFGTPALAVRSMFTSLLAGAVAMGLATAVYLRSDLDAVDAPSLLAIGIVTFAASASTDALLAGRLRRGKMDGDDLDVNIDRSNASGGLDSLTLSLMIALAGLSLVRSGNERIATLGLAIAAAMLAEALVVRTTLIPAATSFLGSTNFHLPAWVDAVVPATKKESEERVLVSSDTETAVKGGSVVSAAIWNLGDAINAEAERESEAASAERQKDAAEAAKDQAARPATPEPAASTPAASKPDAPVAETPATPEPKKAPISTEESDGVKRDLWDDSPLPAELQPTANGVTEPIATAPKTTTPITTEPEPTEPEIAEPTTPEPAAAASTTAESKPAQSSKPTVPSKPTVRYTAADQQSPLDDPFLAALSDGKDLESEHTLVTASDGPADPKPATAATDDSAASDTPTGDTPSEDIGGKASPDASDEGPTSSEIAATSEPPGPAERPTVDASDVDPKRLEGLPALFQRVAVLEDDNARVLERLAGDSDAASSSTSEVLVVAARFSNEHRDAAIECFDELITLGADMPEAFDTSTDTTDDVVTDRHTATSKMQMDAIELLDNGTLHPEAAEELRWWLNRSVSQWQAIERAGLLGEPAGSG